jgi:hypothetical protein
MGRNTWIGLVSALVGARAVRAAPEPAVEGAGRADAVPLSVGALPTAARVAAGTCVRRALDHLDRGEPHVALALLDGLVTADPVLGRAISEIRVQAFLERGDVDAALRVVQRERLRPAYPHDVAQALRRRGRRTEALGLAATIRTHTPLEARAVANLMVDLHLEMGDIDGAREVLRTRPADAIAQANVGTALLGRRRVEEAKALLEGACPELEGTAEAPWCQDVLVQARSR